MFRNNMVFLDFDGVLLDTEERIQELKRKYSELSWEIFLHQLDWQKLLSEAEEINNALSILKELEDLNQKMAILTKIHTPDEAKEKIKYIRNKELKLPVLIVPPHVKKSEVYVPTSKDILIDDSIKNVTDWNSKGGQGILFSNEEDQKEDGISRVRSLEFMLK